MATIITVVWVGIELLSLLIFLRSFLVQRQNNTRCYLSLLLLWVIMAAYSSTGPTNSLRPVITMALAIVWSLYTFKGPWLSRILVVVLSYIFSGIFDVAVCYGASAVLGISYADLVWKKLLYTAVGTAAKLLYLFFAYTIFRMRKNRVSTPLHGSWTLLTVLFPAASIIIVVTVFLNYQDSTDLSVGAFICSGILAVANIAVLYLIHIMEKRITEEKELMLLNQQMDIQAKSISALEKSYRAQRVATHEFNHHLQTIHDLLEQKELETLTGYVNQLQGIQTTRLLSVNTRHPIIDAVLNQKHQAAKELDIEIEFHVTDLSGISIDTTALVVLLSNLLDNAIEACQQIPGEKMINCTIAANDELFISIKNPSVPVVINNGLIETTKTPKEEHGYGLITVKHILNQLNAEHTIHYEDGYFQVAAEIPTISK